MLLIVLQYFESAVDLFTMSITSRARDIWIYYCMKLPSTLEVRCELSTRAT